MAAARFLSTLPARGATSNGRHYHPQQRISIHAPREGSDRTVTSNFARPTKISIHAPREGSDGLSCRAFLLSMLISIHAPREGSDNDRFSTRFKGVISIHAPREGSDPGLP